LVAPVLAAIVALAIAGCGGGGSSSSDSTDPASLAPAGSPTFIEVTKPEGKAAEEVDSLVGKIAGVHNLGGFIVSELERQALGQGEELNYEKEIEPWLGKRAGFFGLHYENGGFTELGIDLQTTDPAATSKFLDKQFGQGGKPVTDRSFEGVDYKVLGDGGTFGVIGNFLAYAENDQIFKEMVEASEGESLAGSHSYSSAVASAPADALARLYFDIGALVEKSGEPMDPETAAGLKLLGIEPKGATALASAIPGSNRIEIDLASNVLIEPPPAADVSFLLGSMPAGSVAALASPEAGTSIGNAIDRLDGEGIPAEGVPPHQLKNVMKAAGIELESIASSLTDAAVFLEGESESSLGGAAVLITDGANSQELVKQIGLLVRATGAGGVTAIGGRFSGFSVRSSGLGNKPLVVVANGVHVVIGYGLAAVKSYFAEPQEILAETPVFKEAAASLGGTPISGFAEGHAALRLASALVSPGDEGFRKAKRYLTKIAFLALGSESSGDQAKAKLIVGLGG
jgi:hypothetical protein